jgi:hypothetical protein
MGRFHYIIIFAGFASAAPAAGQLSPISYNLAASTYQQDFNGLPATGSFSVSGKGPVSFSAAPINAVNLTGWQLWMPAGSNTNAVFAPGTGSGTGNGIYSLGASGNSDRALGSLSSSTGIYAFGLVITNTTGMALNTCTITLTIEQWRRGGSGNRNTWSFRYKTGSFTGIDQTNCSSEPGLDLFSLNTTGSGGSLNGNLPENRQQISLTLQQLNWKAGEQLLLRWDDADEPGSDDICAIDNFSFTASQNISPPAATALTANSISPSSAVLKGIVNEQFANTAVFFEYDTTGTFSQPLSARATPDSILQGTGNTAVSADIADLLTGISYYARIKAINVAGTTYSSTIQFTTAFGLPVVTGLTPADISPGSAVLGGTISHTGGLPITGQGITWSLTDTGAGTQVNMVLNNLGFSGSVTGLPPGTTVYVKAYATNSMGTAYGNPVSFTTPTTILSLTPTDPLLSNASTVHFNLQTAQHISGLTAANFLVISDGPVNTGISSISGSGKSFTITLATGTGDGNISLQLANDTLVFPSIYNKVFTASTAYRIDRSPPLITHVRIPNNSMKLGDTVVVNILVKPDTSLYTLQSGKINGQSPSGFSKKNDSLYTCLFVISSATPSVAADASIPVSIVLTDPAGNSNVSYQTPITQSLDAIDASRPSISQTQLPADSLYKAGDTLAFVLRFNEKIQVTTIAIAAGFSSTIGSRTKLVNYIGGSGTDSLLFRYIIPAGELDNDGIRINSPLPLVNMEIRDPAGNPAILSYTFPITKNILVDAVAPAVSSVITPTPASYRTGNLLDMLVNFSEKVWTGTDTPQLGLLIGNNTRYAVYTSGSGSTSLLFRYLIVDEDIDKDGIKLVSTLIATSPIQDAAGNPAALTLSNIGALSGVLINPPTITISKLTAPPDSTYRYGDTLEFGVQFNENAFVDTKNGTPAIRLTIGSSAKQALYAEGSGSNTLLFRYPIQKNESDTDGIRISPTIALNNGSIKDEKGNSIPLTLNNIPNTIGLQVDAMDPFVKNLVTPARRMYATGDTMDFTLNFSETVFQEKKDSLSIGIIIGTTRKNAFYVSGAGSTSWLFRYLVAAGDLDKNGIKIDSVITTNNGLLCDRWGNKLLTKLENIGPVSDCKVDGIAPVFTEKNSELIICENAGDISIGGLLAIRDEESGETLNWQLREGLTAGTLSRQMFSGTSNGNIVTPKDIYYRPAPNKSGRDSIIVQVTDGTYTSQKTIRIVIQGRILQNEIGPPQQICAGNTAALISGAIPEGGDGKYNYQWEFAANNEAPNFSKAPGINNLSYYSPGKLSNTSWFRRKVFSGTCEDVSAPTQVLVLKSGLWTGNYSSDWNNPNNWCTNTLPDQTTDVIIIAGTPHSPEITDSAAVNQLQLRPGASLKISGLLKLRTALQNEGGSIDASNGSVMLNGTMKQIIPSGIFHNNELADLYINDTAGVVLTGPLQINNSLVLNSGSVSTNNLLKLREGAAIGASAIGTGIQGEIVMEKKIHSKRPGYHLLGHPFFGQLPLSMISDSISATNQAPVFFADTSLAITPLLFDTIWTPFTHTTGMGSNTWNEFSGIRLWVSDTSRLVFSGRPHTGNQEIRLPQTDHPSFFVFANPYPAPIDLSKLNRSHHIARYYWVWHPQQGMRGGYTSLPFSFPFTRNPFDAFIIRSDGGAGSLLFTENSKTTRYAVDSLPPAYADAAYFIELRIESDSIFWDRLLLVHADSASNYFDLADAEKIGNPDLNFYSFSRDNQALSIDTRPISNNSIIGLAIKTALQRSFRINISALNLPPGNSLQLHDKWLEKWMKLEKDSSYAFSITADTMSSGDQRFEIARFRSKPDTGTLPKLITNLAPIPAREKIKISFSAPEKAHTIIRLLSLAGRPLRQVDLGLQQNASYELALNGLSPGIYLIEIRCGDQIKLQKLIKN